MLPKIFLKDIRLMALSEIARDELDSLRGSIRFLQIHDIDNVHPSFLPFLAYIYRADSWDDEWPIEHQREVVKGALLLFKYKGTIWAVERALEISMFDATVTPWYAMTPVGERGTFKVDATRQDGRGLNQDDYNDCVKLIESNKQGSQQWRMSVKNEPSVGFLYTPGVVRSRKRIVIQSKA